METNQTFTPPVPLLSITINSMSSNSINEPKETILTNPESDITELPLTEDKLVLKENHLKTMFNNKEHVAFSNLNSSLDTNHTYEVKTAVNNNQRNLYLKNNLEFSNIMAVKTQTCLDRHFSNSMTVKLIKQRSLSDSNILKTDVNITRNKKTELLYTTNKCFSDNSNNSNLTIPFNKTVISQYTLRNSNAVNNIECNSNVAKAITHSCSLPIFSSINYIDVYYTKLHCTRTYNEYLTVPANIMQLPKRLSPLRSLSHPNPTITNPPDSEVSSSSTKHHRHSIAGQMSYFKMLGFNCGGPLIFKKVAGGSVNSLFSTAVISGSSSAPNLRDMIPSTASASALEGFGGVPPIRPLETLHNALSLRQLDTFLEQMTSVPLFKTPSSTPPKYPSTPVITPTNTTQAASSNSCSSSHPPPLKLQSPSNSMGWSGPPSFVSSSSGPSSPGVSDPYSNSKESSEMSSSIVSSDG